ncbi:hypothetical protein ACPPVO_25385 [Dactylosporangium sp. McL0621]|uniref:hypothetical protein n=1 Tax=Dactylosporangium sp. McL0621 TaxID=3415678 RepID=UPI003CF42AD0
MPAAQRTAWAAFLMVTRGLLPAVDDERMPAATEDGDLLRFALRIERDAPLWGEHGPMLLAALRDVQAMRWGGDRADLADLLRVMAHRLYVISAGPRPPRHDGHGRRRCRRNVGAY